MFKLNISNITLIVLILSNYCFSQTEYPKWLKRQKKEYNDFISKEDKEFVKYLKEGWKQSDLNKGLKAFPEPKPENIPSISSDKQKTLPNVRNLKSKNYLPADAIKTQIIDKLDNNPSPMKINEVTEINANIAISNLDMKTNNMSVDIDYYSCPIKYYYNFGLRIYLNKKINSESIANWWAKMSSADYKSCLVQAQYYREKLKLNDWAFIKLLYSYAKNIYPNTENERNLFIWYMMNKSGYMVRVCYSDRKIGLLVASKNKIFGQSFYSQNGIDYHFYTVSLDKSEKTLSGSVHIYREDFPGSDKPVDMSIITSPELSSSIGTRDINIQYGNSNYFVRVSYNKSDIEFFRNYPQINYGAYFKAPLSDSAKSSLLPVLKKYITGLDEHNAANFLLHFVQYATKYKTDDSQFGREKTFFPEESLYYEYSDCEDRAILFAYLIRNLLSLKVIGLDYPNHISTAVYFNEDVKGSYINYDDQKYIICDPTYIGAEVGMAMPQYLNSSASVIEY